jgi:hypothetical protein
MTTSYCILGADVPESNHGEGATSVRVRSLHHQQETHHICKCTWLLVCLWEACEFCRLSERAHRIKHNTSFSLQTFLFLLKLQDGKKANNNINNYLTFKVPSIEIFDV